MSVASKNAFALLEDDSSRPSTPAPAAAKAAAATPAPAAATRGTQKSRGGPASRGGRYYQRGGKSSGPRDGQNGDVAAEDATGDVPRKRFEGEGRGRGRGGRGRGGERGRGGRGRPFDKHSATGKTDSEKKVGQGWGHEEGSAELKDETAGETDAKVEAGAPAEGGWGAETSTDAWGAPTEGAATGEAAADDKADGRPRREPEEEDNTLTLEEYLKQKKELELVPKLETRKANEGDDSIWKDAIAVTKKDDDEDAYFVGKTKSAPKARTKKEEKVFLEIDARFERPQRGGRGGRGGDRGDRPRGGRGRGGRGRGANGNTGGPTLNVADETAFPSLA
ncbi:hypothetical protein BDY19DRAFT_901792 [Irpex rosettiformis]|uniref:Uncharacterized protein n=1 Tax=Irpex rosettiformis TaxID=378272 RepID=A0ACB8ULT5_9APHY|nr:hypothetical protein BDY19DRAFT_901792 [Irpex rosettiformis]